MKRNKVLKSEMLFLLALLILAAMIRTHVFIISDNGMTGAFDKIYSLIQWINSDTLIPELFNNFLHTYLLWIAVLCYKNVLISTRMVSFIFGIASIFPYYYLVKLLFNKKTAFFSTLFLCIFSIHVSISVVSLAMSPYIFFLLCSLYYFFLYKKNFEFKFLILAAIMLNLTAMLRFEGWLFIPILTMLTIDKKRKLNFFLFALISSIFPYIYMLISYQATGNPLLVLSSANNISFAGSKNPLGVKAWGWFYVFYRLLSPLGFILAFICVVKSIFFWKNTKYLLAIIFLMNLVVFEYKSLNHTYDPLMTKYSCPLILLIVPYMFVQLKAILKWLTSLKTGYFKGWMLKGAEIFLLLLFFVNLTFYSVKEIRRDLKKHRIPSDFKRVVLWIKEKATDKDKFMIDLFNYYGYTIITSGLDFKQFLNPSIDVETGKIMKKDFFQQLTNNKALYLIYPFKETFYLNQLVSLSKKKVQRKEGLTFKLLHLENNWAVFKVY